MDHCQSDLTTDLITVSAKHGRGVVKRRKKLLNRILKCHSSKS